MELVIDKAGRVVLPRGMREALGLDAGAVVDASLYGSGIQLVPGGRTARLVDDADGLPVAESTTVIDDETVFALIDSGRK